MPLRARHANPTTETSTSGGALLRIPHTNAADRWLIKLPAPQDSSAADSRPNAGNSPDPTE
jgi:hypothetical protein